MTIDHSSCPCPTPADLANEAAQAIRALNHATFPGQARLVFPSDVYSAIGSLQRVAGMLPQALSQLEEWLEAEHAAGRVVANWGAYDGETDLAVLATRMHLGAARVHLGDVHSALGEAHVATAGLAVPE